MLGSKSLKFPAIVVAGDFLIYGMCKFGFVRFNDKVCSCKVLIFIRIRLLNEKI